MHEDGIRSEEIGNICPHALLNMSAGEKKEVHEQHEQNPEEAQPRFVIDMFCWRIGDINASYM